jgi:hypothetical protein
MANVRLGFRKGYSGTVCECSGDDFLSSTEVWYFEADGIIRHYYMFSKLFNTAGHRTVHILLLPMLSMVCNVLPQSSAEITGALISPWLAMSFLLKLPYD